MTGTLAIPAGPGGSESAASSAARRGDGWSGEPPSFVHRIAVCISGEFRHVHHRTPEQQIRQLLSFLTGVECDLFVHGWHNASEALIVGELKPRAWKFEPRPSFSRLVDRIRHVEPNIKPGRDEGSLSMFYSWQECFALVAPFRHQYSHIVRIRPDLFVDFSLLEILAQIDGHGVLPDTVYVPHMFHSKGINDQIAFGPVDRMETYLLTLDSVVGSIDHRFFNPETALLHNLVSSGVPIAFAHIPYALMREVPIRINTVHERFHSQFHVWWSRTEWLPTHRDLSAYFADKLRTVDDLMRKLVPELLYLRVPARIGRRRGRAVIRLRMIDNDPALTGYSLHCRLGLWLIRPFTLRAGEVVVGGAEVRHQVFAHVDGEQLVLSEWKMEDGELLNERIAVGSRDRAATARAFRVPIRLALRLKALADRWRRQPA